MLPISTETVEAVAEEAAEGEGMRVMIPAMAVIGSAPAELESAAFHETLGKQLPRESVATRQRDVCSAPCMPSRPPSTTL